MLKLKPKNPIYYPVERPVFSHRVVPLPAKRKHIAWTDKDESLIITHKELTPRDICRLFPDRSRMSVLTRISRLRKRGAM